MFNDILKTGLLSIEHHGPERAFFDVSTAGWQPVFTSVQGLSEFYQSPHPSLLPLLEEKFESRYTAVSFVFIY